MFSKLMELTGWTKPVVICGVVVASLLALGVAKCTYDRNLIANHEAKTEARIQKKAREADQKAADERIENDRENRRIERLYNDAIREGDDPRIALACVRLRRAGYSEDQLPAPCRP